MQMQNSYAYRTSLIWTTGRTGMAESGDAPALSISAPPEFSGKEGFWSPEKMLVSAAEACLMTTFLAIAEISKLKVKGYSSSATGKLEKVEGEGYRFTTILIEPFILVAARDLERAERLLHKAEKNCFIASSLRATIQVTPRFTVSDEEQQAMLSTTAR